ncbi:MAG: thioesterase [Bacteroidales bacterium]|nr:thioesterase [Bacteroidales bacterium]
MRNTLDIEYRVMYHDADMTGRLSIPALGNYVLDAAGLHAIELGVSMQQLASQGMTWVMSGMRYQLHLMPPINSTVQVHTQISEVSRISSKRDFIITCGGQPVAEISTEWLIINTRTRRPVFISEAAPGIESMKSADTGIPKYRHIRTAPKEASACRKTTIQYSDIDINSHLYSIRYLAMALDTLDPEVLKNGSIRAIDVNFVQEVMPGDTVELAWETSGQETLVEMRGDGKVKFRAIIETSQMEC